MSKHFNQLTPAEHERLSLLIEEMGESLQAAGKILRHGYESSWDGGPTNRVTLCHELGDVRHCLQRLIDAGDLDEVVIERGRADKAARVGRFLHHQDRP